MQVYGSILGKILMKHSDRVYKFIETEPDGCTSSCFVHVQHTCTLFASLYPDVQIPLGQHLYPFQGE